jgi:hypothetical protein
MYFSGVLERGVRFQALKPKEKKVVINRDVVFFFLMKKPCYNILRKKKNKGQKIIAIMTIRYK